MQNLLQNHYPLSPPEHQKLSEEIDREKEINQVLKWTEKLEKTFDQHEGKFWPKLTEMRTVMDKQITKANQAVKEAENALRDAIVAERTAKGQPIHFKKTNVQRKSRILPLKPIILPEKAANQHNELKIEEDFVYNSQLE